MSPSSSSPVTWLRAPSPAQPPMRTVGRGPEIAFTPIGGGERIARLNDDHYTAELFAQARDEDFAARFARIAAIAGHVPMTRLVRPRDPARFDEVTARVAAWIKEN